MRAASARTSVNSERSFRARSVFRCMRSSSGWIIASSLEIASHASSAPMTGPRTKKRATMYVLSPSIGVHATSPPNEGRNES